MNVESIAKTARRQHTRGGCLVSGCWRRTQRSSYCGREPANDVGLCQMHLDELRESINTR